MATHSSVFAWRIPGTGEQQQQQHAPNIGTPQYIRQILTDIKGEIDGNTIIIGVFNTTHMDGQIIKTEN